MATSKEITKQVRAIIKKHYKYWRTYNDLRADKKPAASSACVTGTFSARSGMMRGQKQFALSLMLLALRTQKMGSPVGFAGGVNTHTTASCCQLDQLIKSPNRGIIVSLSIIRSAT